MADTTHLRLLGPAQVEDADQTVHGLPFGKALALLGYLVAQDRPLSREHLADLFWPDKPADRGRANLSWLLHDVSTRLPGCLDANPDTVRFQRSPSCCVDLDEFADLAARGDAAALTEAVELYRGDLLEGLNLDRCADFEVWLVGERERWRRRAVRVLIDLVTYHARRGEHRQGLRYARRLLALEPWQEEAHRQVMRLLALDGQRTAALRQYEECARILKEELDLSPSEETTSLYEEIRTSPPEREERPLVPPRPKHNLPAQTTRFIGREEELAAIRARLGEPDCRLLSLVGPGGCGKTRLALEAAAAQLDNFEHGAFFVSLAPLRSVDTIALAVANALGLRFHGEGEPWQQLLDYLSQKNLLLVLDNFEHLLAPPQEERKGGVELATDVLEKAPNVKVLATSRARLNAPSEHVFPVAGMRLPSAASTLSDPTDAIQLFLVSARRAQPDFALTPDNHADVARICHLVGGIPLGIVLAAAWVHVLSPTEIATQTRRSLDFLESDLRGVPERQRSMRATFDHSWGLLSAREREVFRGLSAFRGGFTQEAAQEVTGAALPVLLGLANKSFLERTPGGRYQVHELLRQYGEEKLDQTPDAGEAARDRHCTYYASLLQGFAADLKGPRQVATLARMDVEIDNVRAAWEWAVARGQVARVDRALEALALYYNRLCYYYEGEAVFRRAAQALACREWEGEEALGALGERVRVWAWLLAWQGTYNFSIWRNERAERLLRQSLEILEQLTAAGWDTRREKAWALHTLGGNAWWNLHDLEQGRRLFRQSLALYEALGDRWGMGRVLGHLGQLAEHSSRYGEARQLCERSLSFLKEVGDYDSMVLLLGMLGIQAVHLGETEEAGRRVREGFALLEQVGRREEFTHNVWVLGWASLWLGRFDVACAVGEENLSFDEERRDRERLVSSSALLSLAQVGLGRYGQARIQAQAGLVVAREIGWSLGAGLVLLALGRAALAEGACAEAQRLLQECVAAHEEGGTPHDAGIALGGLGLAARGLAQPAQARQHLCKALRVGLELGTCLPLMHGLPGIALLLADEGQHERAAEVYALASRYPAVANSRWYEGVVGRHIAAVAENMPPEVVAAARERGRARDLHATAAELLAELER